MKYQLYTNASTIIYAHSLVRVVSNNFLVISFLENTPLNIQLKTLICQWEMRKINNYNWQL